MAATLALVILGSGSTAFAAALEAGAVGKTAVMTEAGTRGGTGSLASVPGRGTIRICPVSP